MRKLLISGVLVLGVVVGGGIAATNGPDSAKVNTGPSVVTETNMVGDTDRVGDDMSVFDWTGYTKTNGAEAALAGLIDRINDNPNFASACHSAAHDIGKAAAGSIELQDSLELEPELCLNGYTHGLLQALSADPKTVFADILLACVQAKGGKMATECIHGAGHLLALRHPSSLTSSLGECLNVESSLQDWCVGGTMMEYGQNYLAQRWPDEYRDISRTMGPTSPTVINLPAYETTSPCTLLPETAAMSQCWSELGPFIIGTADNLGAVGSMSEKCRSSTEELQMWCLYSLFGWLTDNLDTNVDETGDDVAILGGIVEGLCNQVEAEFLIGCLNGAIYRVGMPRDIEVVEGICALWEGNGDWALGCAMGVETVRTTHKNSGI